MTSLKEKAINYVADKLFVWIWTSALSVLGFAALAVWAYLRNLPVPIIAMLAIPCCMVCMLAACTSISLFRELTSKRTALKIEYEPRKHHAVDSTGFSVSRFLVRNPKSRNTAEALVVNIESLVDLTSTSAHIQASSFINVPMHLERPDSKDNVVVLKANRSVEVFGPKAPKSSDRFYFPTTDPNAGKLGSFFSGATVYRMTVFASADNADPARRDFLLYQRDGILQVAQYSNRLARTVLQQRPAAITAPTVASDVFVGRWRILAEGTEHEFTIVLSASGEAVRVQSDAHALGKWETVGAEARITWGDKKWKDILRPLGDRVRKLAFSEGKSWDDQPTNQQWAEKIPD